MSVRTTTHSINSNQLEKAEAKVCQLLRKFVAHGFFNLSITGTVVKNGKRAVIISAGEEHKFTIPIEDIPKEYISKDGS